jgi:hypothetical protein
MVDIKKFSIELTIAQAHAINKILPQEYCLLIEKENKNKKSNKKKKCTNHKPDNPHINGELEEPPVRAAKTKNAIKYGEDNPAISSYARAGSQNYYDELEDAMKPCLRILHLLKNHKTAWPFKEPVDPIALNIPHYSDIIKEPMDLQTIDRNLKSKVYVTPTQFHADIGKIIRNSYEFNKNNTEFYKLTNEFELFYNKIRNDSPNPKPIHHASNPNPTTSQTTADPKKKKSKPVNKTNEPRFREPSDTQPATLAEKKALTLQIKKLPKESLKEVIEIVYEGKVPTTEELNIENLPNSKIRQLQRYIRNKSNALEVSCSQERHEQMEANEGARQEESSFESDSDS